ncbi:MAG: Rpn family recombination-promoting nuclease/putative transposase, partial [Oscillospiraceae bacterium]|nr:Rpn family recombination-promoting nuclease/putative transposase [Oscillospiraceae bacterium]
MDNKNNVSANRKYKDSIFTKLFGEKDKLAELYNAISGTNYTPDDIGLLTLENIIFIGRENDIAFMIDGRLIVLVEHQSSINPNMPLRFLLYIAREYQILADNEAMYSSRLVKIPPPEFIVVYNGKDEYPEESELNLSDAFIDSGIDNLELKVKVYNINKGYSAKIMSRSGTLRDYSTFVSRARANRNAGLELPKALEKAVKDCVQD